MKRKTKRKTAGKLLNPESFAAHIEAATRKAGFAIAGREGTMLQVMLHDQPVRCNLEPIYHAYKGSPDRLDDIVQTHLDALGRVPPPPSPTEKEAAESLLPMLQQNKWLKHVRRRGGAPLPHRPFIAGLVITYVFDFPDHRAYVNKDILAQMTDEPGFTFDMIHEYALENLRKRTTSEHYEMHGWRDETVVICQTADGYAATRILLPDLMEKWAERIPGQMLIGIPNRDFMIAFSDRNRKHRMAIARQVRRDAKRRDHPLCAGLLVWQDGKIKEYHPRQ